ncbi:uncharacterized protein F4807DRAFT_445608 [Annulohypoxylon truncatum]|uniref:uncharacterized protein n=1 Tax=Annulohypoxylon truncatum TaxID=327061 RepID=UPI002007F5C6|nr:uncharacterized protein F4807DRAFT_445608 [Annulohypoxylon truncatum]KAI1204782.1 hypothetical protein F4807DRAFT_445608 [Annulohypoxylon truncatum]
MAPIRRYLRITKYSVIECRIYLDNPALAQTWLLNPRNPALPRVIESVRPLVLPKLREERERSRKRSTKKKGIKDVVVEDDFEVSIFLTETSTRHALLTKHKHFHDTTQTKLTSNSGRLIGETNEAPIDVDATTGLGPVIRREESDDEDAAVTLAAIPAADETAADSNSSSGRRPKRARKNTETEAEAEAAVDPDQDVEIVSDSQEEDDQDDQDDLFVHDDDTSTRPPPSKRRKGSAREAGESAEAEAGAGLDKDDKKKLAMDISYEGFSIYGRVLCLVVKRRDGNIGSGPQQKQQQQQAGRGSKAATASAAGSHATKPGGGGQAMMENFILSTQVPAGAEPS